MAAWRRRRGARGEVLGTLFGLGRLVARADRSRLLFHGAALGRALVGVLRSPPQTLAPTGDGFVTARVALFSGHGQLRVLWGGRADQAHHLSPEHRYVGDAPVARVVRQRLQKLLG